MRRRITTFDKQCLSAFAHRMFSQSGIQSPDLVRLEEILDSAEIVNESPTDLVTLDSKVLLRNVLSGRQLIYSPVLPAQADIKGPKVSILAPLGLEMLGRMVGDTFEVTGPAGTTVFSIEKVLLQLESSDDGCGSDRQARRAADLKP